MTKEGREVLVFSSLSSSFLLPPSGGGSFTVRFVFCIRPKSRGQLLIRKWLNVSFVSGESDGFFITLSNFSKLACSISIGFLFKQLVFTTMISLDNWREEKSFLYTFIVYNAGKKENVSWFPLVLHPLTLWYFPRCMFLFIPVILCLYGDQIYTFIPNFSLWLWPQIFSYLLSITSGTDI